MKNGEESKERGVVKMIVRPDWSFYGKHHPFGHNQEDKNPVDSTL
jgi:hypothetical protein